MIKKFGEYKINENDSQEEYEYMEDYKEAESRVNEYLDEAGLEADVDMDPADPGIYVDLKKSNSCFNSGEMDNFFSGEIGRGKDGGLNKSGFMGDYTLFEEMSDQLAVINAIAGSLEEESGGSIQRVYVVGDSIRFELFIG